MLDLGLFWFIEVSMSLGHSVLFKLRRREWENTSSESRFDHGDLLVMDTACQLQDLRVILAFR